MSYKLSMDRVECIGCGACVANCPALFEMNDDNKSKIKGAELKDLQEKELEDIACGQDAAEGCPVSCIHIEKDGSKIA